MAKVDQGPPSGQIFTPAHVVGPGAAISTPIEILLDPCVRILVPAEFEPEHLRRVILAARAAC